MSPRPMVYLLQQGPLSRKASSHMEGLSTFPAQFPAGWGLCAASCHVCSPEPLELKRSQPQEVNSVLQSTRTVSLNGLFIPFFRVQGPYHSMVCSHSVDETGIFSRILQNLSFFLGESQTINTKCLLGASLPGDFFSLVQCPFFLQWPSTVAGTYLCLIRIEWIER